MTKFFQVEKAAYGGVKDTFRNVEFKKNNFDNSAAAEAGTILEIIPAHIKNPPVIQFIAYMKNLTDSISTSNTATQPFGRPDPYYIWKSNQRTLSVRVDIPSTSVAKGLDNLNNLSWFLASLYPTYKDTNTTTSIAASPLFRVRFGNLICSSTKDGQGLLGVIEGTRVQHDLSVGVIPVDGVNVGSSFANEAASLLKESGFSSNIREGKRLMVPKLINLSFNLKVVHDHTLGWDFSTGQWRGGLSAPRFPYDFGLTRDVSDTPAAESAQNANSGVPGRDQDEAQVQVDDVFGAGVGTKPGEVLR